MGREGYYIRDKKIYILNPYEQGNGNIRIYSNQQFVCGYMYEKNKNLSFEKLPDCNYLPDENFMKELVDIINESLPNRFNNQKIECIEIDCTVKSDMILDGTRYMVVYYNREMKDDLPQYQILDENSKIVYPENI